MSQTSGTFVKQISFFFFFFVRVNHRGPLPLRELHSTGETKSVERPWGILSLFTTCLRLQVKSLPEAVTQTSGIFVKQVFSGWITADPSPWGNFTPPAKQQCGETLGDLEPVYDLFTIASETTLPEAVSQTSGTFVKQISFFSFFLFKGESPRTPPLEGTSLHRRNKECGETLGGLEPVYDLFTIISEITARGCDTDKWHLCKAGFFKGESPRTPLPLRELHSTGETTVWRDPGGSWACLWPIHHCKWNHSARGCVTDKWHLCKTDQLFFLFFLNGESPRTPPLEGTSLHRRNKECGETLGDLEPVYDLFTITSEITARGCDTDKWHLCKAGFF